MRVGMFLSYAGGFAETVGARPLAHQRDQDIGMHHRNSFLSG
jgi:hypothetical protein